MYNCTADVLNQTNGGAYGPSSGGEYGPGSGGEYGPGSGGEYGPGSGGEYGPGSGGEYGPGGSYGPSYGPGGDQPGSATPPVTLLIFTHPTSATCMATEEKECMRPCMWCEPTFGGMAQCTSEMQARFLPAAVYDCHKGAKPHHKKHHDDDDKDSVVCAQMTNNNTWFIVTANRCTA